MYDKDKTSESLAAIIITYRSLGLFKDEAKQAMIELSRRKDLGDTFDFDSYIKEKLNQVPKSVVNKDVLKLLGAIGSVGNAR